jgi:hypothetical protein
MKTSNAWSLIVKPASFDHELKGEKSVTYTYCAETMGSRIPGTGIPGTVYLIG